MGKIGFNTKHRPKPRISKGDFVNVFLCQPPITLSGVYQGREDGEVILSRVFGVQFNEDGTREIRASNYPQKIPLGNVSSYIKTTKQDYRGRLKRHKQDLILEEMQREVHGRELHEKLSRLRNQEYLEFS